MPTRTAPVSIQRIIPRLCAITTPDPTKTSMYYNQPALPSRIALSTRWLFMYIGCLPRYTYIHKCYIATTDPATSQDS